MGVACAEAVDETPTYRMPDLYVVDLNLPGEDGLALARRLRQAKPNAGIVITTARTAIDDRLQGYGIRDDINKWIAGQTLTALQQKATTQLARSMQRMLQVDASNKTAARAQAEVDGNAIDCVYAAFDADSPQPHQIVSQLESMTANTKERAEQYIRYNAALGGMAFSVPVLPRCD